MSQTEWHVWFRLRARQVDGWKFRRQQPIGPYYVDFYCPGARLIVEIAGPTHDEDAQWAYDQRKFAWLEAEGYRVVRIVVEDVDLDLDGVIESIYGELLDREALGFSRRPHSRHHSPPALRATSP